MNKPIIDVCCGSKMFYFDKNDRSVLFQDIRCMETELKDRDKLRHFSVKPDVIGDFTNMTYPDGSFRMVVFDPPHLKYTGSMTEANGWQMVKYGCLPAHGWRELLQKGFDECFRVLQEGGILVFKWN